MHLDLLVTWLVYSREFFITPYVSVRMHIYIGLAIDVAVYA